MIVCIGDVLHFHFKSAGTDFIVEVLSVEEDGYFKYLVFAEWENYKPTAILNPVKDTASTARLSWIQEYYDVVILFRKTLET